MANDVTMPRLSDSMEEGTVLKWLVDVGDEVKRGEPLVEIETDKANMTYDADADGVLTEVLAQEGDTLAIGEVIARIGDAGEVKENGDEPSGDAAEEGGAEAEGDELRQARRRGQERRGVPPRPKATATRPAMTRRPPTQARHAARPAVTAAVARPRRGPKPRAKRTAAAPRRASARTPAPQMAPVATVTGA